MLALAALLLAGCATPKPSPAPPTTALPSTGALQLPTALRDAIDPASILADLDRLAVITKEHGGTRAAGTDGYAAAADWAAGVLRDAGFEVALDPVTVPSFTQDGPGVLEILGADAPAFEGPRDFKAMLLSPSGDVTGPVYAFGFDPEAKPGDRNGVGCDAGAWGAVPAGSIVLVQPGSCWARKLVEHAQDAGAVALISSYPEWGPGLVRRPTLLNPGGLAIPVVGTTREVGLALAEAARNGDQVHLRVTTTTTLRPSDNVIAETPGGDAGAVVMLGAHLDSALDGPGINDNGTGVAVVLEIARRLAALTGGDQRLKVRVALWTGEELGLWGSVEYVNSLTSADRGAIAAYLNLDTLGSPGGKRQAYDAVAFSNPASAGLQRVFSQAFDTDGLSSELIDIGGGSDHYQFDQLGVPVGGIITETGPDDACHHLACDTTDNVDAVLLGQMARAAAWATGMLASGRPVADEGSDTVVLCCPVVMARVVASTARARPSVRVPTGRSPTWLAGRSPLGSGATGPSHVPRPPARFANDVADRDRRLPENRVYRWRVRVYGPYAPAPDAWTRM